MSCSCSSRMCVSHVFLTPHTSPTCWRQVDQNLSVSEHPLSAAYCLARITTALEQHWQIV